MQKASTSPLYFRYIAHSKNNVFKRGLSPCFLYPLIGWDSSPVRPGGCWAPTGHATTPRQARLCRPRVKVTYRVLLSELTSFPEWAVDADGCTGDYIGSLGDRARGRRLRASSASTGGRLWSAGSAGEAARSFEAVKEGLTVRQCVLRGLLPNHGYRVTVFSVAEGGQVCACLCACVKWGRV